MGDIPYLDQTPGSVKLVRLCSSVNFFMTGLAEQHKIIEPVCYVRVRVILFGQLDLVMHNPAGVQDPHRFAPLAHTAGCCNVGCPATLPGMALIESVV